MHPELVNSVLEIAERDSVAKQHLDDLREEKPEITDADAASILLAAAREGVGMSEATASLIIAAHRQESDRLRRVRDDEEGSEPMPPESHTTPGETTIREQTIPSIDPVAELDRFRSTGTDGESIDVGEHGKQLDRERATGRRVLRVNQ
jgi:hypothetical protein